MKLSDYLKVCPNKRFEELQLPFIKLKYELQHGHSIPYELEIKLIAENSQVKK